MLMGTSIQNSVIKPENLHFEFYIYLIQTISFKLNYLIFILFLLF